MTGFLDDVRVLTLLVTVGAFLVTLAGHKAFMQLKQVLVRASPPKGDATPAVAGAAQAPPEAASPTAPAKPKRREDDDGFGFAAAPADAAMAPAAPARPAPAAKPAAQARATTDAGRAAAPVLSKAHPPRPRATDDEDADADEDDLGVETAEWERLMREVMTEESILAENREILSKTRTLKSLLANVRDRDLLVERGRRVGRSMHATGYTDLAQKLAENHVCEDAHFRTVPGGGMHVRMIGTAMAREAPVIGVAVCFIETGLLEAAIGNLEGGRYQVREVRCVVKGDPACEFRADRVEEDAAHAPSLYDEASPGGEVR